MKDKKNLFDSYSKKPLKDEVRKAMNRYFNQLDQKNTPIDVYNLVLREIFELKLYDIPIIAPNSKLSKLVWFSNFPYRSW